MAQRVEEAVEAAWTRPGRVRGTIVALYTRAARSWKNAPGEIARGLREARTLHSRERRFVAEAVHALVRWRRRLSYAAMGDDTLAASTDQLYDAWLARAHEAPLAGRNLGIACSYPDWIVERLLAQWDEARTEAFLTASNARAPLLARANRLKNDRDALAARLMQEGIESRPVALAPDALELLSHQNAYGLQAFRDGLFELQDVASQWVGEVVAPPPRGRILDLCAGAGGKSLHLAALLGGGGRITACDIAGDKLEELRRRTRRAGVTSLEAIRIERSGPLPFSGPFDRVLVDAPCTGTGVFRRNPEARWRLGPNDLLELPEEQLAILRRAAEWVAIGGRLVYATCSVMAAENESVVDRFIAEFPMFERVMLKEILGSERAGQLGDGTVLRTSPERQGADGFFAAVLRRRAE